MITETMDVCFQWCSVSVMITETMDVCFSGVLFQL